MSGPIRIAMWSGPRNLSTALMRAFENRADTAVVDEPVYAAYLAFTGIDHPMRAETLASLPTDWRAVVQALVAPRPDGPTIFYQKHMTHHMTPDVGLEWMTLCRNAFLIRAPERVLASYAARRPEVSFEDIGFARQAELFDREADRLGRAPPVIDAEDVLADPRAILSPLCTALDIAFSEAMLAWPPGRRASDGVWGEAWYGAVERSTGFAPPTAAAVGPLNEELATLAARARPFYEHLAAYRIGLST